MRRATLSSGLILLGIASIILLIWMSGTATVFGQSGGCGGCPNGCTLIDNSGAVCNASGGMTPTPLPPQPTNPPAATQPPGDGNTPQPTQPPSVTDEPSEPTITPDPNQPTVTPDPNATPTPPANECFREVCGGSSPFCPAPGTFITHFAYDCNTGVYLYGSGNVGQLGDTCCDPDPTPEPPPVATPKPETCTDTFEVSEGWGAYNECGMNFKLTASAAIPGYPVWYTPYPRGLVYQEMQFYGDANPGVGSYNWSASVDDWNPELWTYDGETKDADGNPHQEYKDFAIAIRWRQVIPTTPMADPPPCWILWGWDERPWGEPKGMCSITGPGAVHTYETSSAGKPENGPDYLPSYQVQATTYWVMDWKWRWQHYECTEREPDNYCVVNQPGSDDPVECWMGNGAEGHWEHRTKCKKTEWVSKENVGMCDMKNFGQPHTYIESFNVSPAGAGTGGGLPVPVIEVQGVIKK